MSTYIASPTDKLVDEYPDFKLWSRGKDKYSNSVYVYACDEFYFSLIAMAKKPNVSPFLTKYRVWHPDRNHFISIITYEPDNDTIPSSIQFNNNIKLEYGDGDLIGVELDDDDAVRGSWPNRFYIEEDFTAIIFSYVKTFINDFSKWQTKTRD